MSVFDQEPFVPETSVRPEPARVAGLDLLRLAAVGAVILYHYGFWGPASHGVPQVALPQLAHVAQYGFLGVPVFFAISGFVIAYSAEGRTPAGFAIARVSRIYPTFVFCMTLTCAATLMFGSPHFAVTTVQWLANLLIAAPALGQPYVDTSYWSLVIEVVFYAWVTAFMALGIFPRRIDVIILAWLGLTFVNELTIDAPIAEKLLIADDSGFFAVGLLIYEFHRGRRDPRLYALLALATGTAVFQAVHKLERLGVHTGGSFDARIVALLCVVSLAAVLLLTRVRTVPLPAAVIAAAGGLTYPLYLLHMQMGYVVFTAIAPAHHIALWTAAIIAGAFALAFVIWRLVDRPAHCWTQRALSRLGTKWGWSLQHPDVAQGRT